ncbi:Sua5/YciO/YrdC/YwlC family protein [Nocardioides sp. DS6]|uniref:Sua5/YciO/YrdC/YwlC family protein n=1 Tax=Nocardioides eburneus TaxID=3231482 RepID=A0ABV3SX36_9ACTN
MQDGPTAYPDELPGVARACDMLAAGQALVVPNPPPMTYGVVATQAWEVNAVKGRPVDQNVAVSLHDPSEWAAVVPSLDLPSRALDGVVSLLGQRLSLLLPVRADRPPPRWVAPAVRAGQLAAFDGRWSPTAAIWDRFPRLFGSSANHTGWPPAATAQEARIALGHECEVIDGGPFDLESSSRRASTLVGVGRDGRLRLHRRGAQDQSWSSPGGYLAHLAAVAGMSVAESPEDPG